VKLQSEPPESYDRQYWCCGVITLPTLAADPGVAVKANAENATADAMTILPIAFMTFANTLEPPWAPDVIEF
jgi:hypothetical protein